MSVLGENFWGTGKELGSRLYGGRKFLDWQETLEICNQ
jgi:hypothetical protein